MTTDPRATTRMEKVKAEKRGSLDINDFSIPSLLGNPETYSFNVELHSLIVTRLLGLRYELCTPH